MDLPQKLQPVCILLAAGAGLLFGWASPQGGHGAALVEPLLMVMLYFVFLAVDAGRLKASFMDARFTLTALIVNFVWTPVFAWLLGLVFLVDSLDVRIGLVMLLATPCTDWYLVFTGLARGNVELGASILPLNLMLQIVLLPVYLMLFFGGTAGFGPWDVLRGMLPVLAVPVGLAALTRLIAASGADCLTARLNRRGDTVQLVFLCLAVACMFASESRQVFSHPGLCIEMLTPLAVFFAVNFTAVLQLGGRLRLPFADSTALLFTTLARNSPLSLAIAVAVFPDRPLIALSLVIGPLIELPVLGLAVSLVQRLRPATQDDRQA